MQITPTLKLAYAAGFDAANKQMRAAGRKVWNRADRDLATATVHRIMGFEVAA